MPAKRYKVNLRPEECDELQRLVDTGKASASKRRRAQILLKADQSRTGPAWTDAQICDAFDVGQLTVSRTRKAFVLEGLDATLQRKTREHPPVARKLDGDGEAQLITLACSTPVVPDYLYPLECLTFAPLPCTLIADDLALCSASSHEGLCHALRLLSPHRLRCLARAVSPVSAPRKHGLAASAGCLSTHREASQASAS